MFAGPVQFGGRHRNHCPYCLYSLHVDGRVPGDRDSECRSRMAPVGVFARRNGEQALVRRGNWWRNASLSMGALAASLVGVVGWQMHLADQVPTQYVAVLQAGKELPAFLLTVDTKANMFVISAMQKPAESEKSYQLWLVHDEMPQPKSLGVFDDSEMAMRPMAEGKMHDMMMDGTYAVSVEPKGGSPTGLPTGPVVFSGKLIKSTP